MADNEITTLNIDYPDAYRDFYLMRLSKAGDNQTAYRIGFALGFFVGRKHSEHTGQKLKVTQDTIMQTLLELDSCNYDLREHLNAVDERMSKKEQGIGILELSTNYYEIVKNMLLEIDDCMDKEVYDKAFAESLMLVIISLETENVRRQYFPNFWERIKDKLQT